METSEGKFACQCCDKRAPIGGIVSTSYYIYNFKIGIIFDMRICKQTTTHPKHCDNKVSETIEFGLTSAQREITD